MPDISALSTATPIALLPYRIETRYVPGLTEDANGEPSEPGTDLYVRIYPDELQIDTHEPGLTPDEHAARTAFIAAGGHGPDPDAPAVVAAWGQLVASFGPTRAAWIARRVRPAEALGNRGGPWTRAALARCLPDRWVVYGYRGDSLVFQHQNFKVTQNLAVGPPPNANVTPPATPPVGADGIPVDSFAVPPNMYWMVDPVAGENWGMALRIPMGTGDLRLDRLVVVGVRVEPGIDQGAPPEPLLGAKALGDLLTAHRYTGGLGVLPQGVPTNNSNAGRSAAGDEPGGAASSRRELAPDVISGGDGSDGARLAAALGIAPAVLGKVSGAEARESHAAQAMNAALWPATWGYLLRRFLATAASDEALEPYRRHFVDWVRGRGPLATLRIGNQPYGVLPVISLNRFQADPADPVGARVADLVRRIRLLWWPAVGDYSSGSVPVLDVLKRRAVPDGYRVRGAFSSTDWSGSARGFMGLDRPGFEARIGKAGAEHAAVRSALNLPPFPPVAAIQPLVTEASWAGVLTVAGADPTARNVPWLADFRDRLLAERPSPDVEAGGWPGKPADSLLYLLLRQGAARVASGPAPDPREYAARGFFGDAPEPAGLGRYEELMAALHHLGTLSPAAVDLATRETLDLAGVRLDAWATSVATRRLAKLRTNPGAGLVLGGYAWVEDLRPGPAGEPADTPPGELPGLVTRPDNAGYLHAPSLAQAATAAVLRSGHLNHAEEHDEAGSTPFAQDLSSRRVRLAMAVLEGLRQGQSLGALIGYRAERTLHDIRQAGTIPAIRRAVARLAGRPVPSDVVDGVVLLKAHTAGRIEWGTGDLPAFAAVEPALEVAAEALDAVGDLSVAEGVHQTLQGNYVRASAALAIGKADGVAPPDLDVIRTPRTGAGITHRLMVMLDAPPLSGTEPGGWSVGPREAAEPALAAWVAALLGSPARLVVDVDLRHPRTGEALGPVRRLDVRDALPYPLELLACAADPAAIEARLADHYLDPSRRPAGLRPDARLRTLTDPASPVPPDRVYLSDLLEAVRAIGALLATARPLSGQDLAPAGTAADESAGVVLDDIRERATAALANLSTVEGALRAVVNDVGGDGVVEGPVDLAAAPDALLAAAGYGVPGAIPAARHALGATLPDGRPDADAVVASQSTMAKQALATYAEVRRRTAAARGLAAAATRADDHVAVLRAVFGETFRPVPRFNPADADTVGRAFTGTAVAPAAAGQEPLAWFARMARVRAQAAAAETLCRYSQALGTGRGLALSIGQLPAPAAGGPAQRWVGLPPAGPDDAVPGSVTSLVAVGARPAQTGSLAGLLLDEWAEVVPAKQETTAVTYHYNAPGNQAPQAILLAVPPRTSGNWTMDDLVATVNETLDLAKIRAVDRADLGADHLFGTLAQLPLRDDGDAPPVDVGRLAQVPATFGVPETQRPPVITGITTVVGNSPFSAIRQGSSVEVRVTGQELANPVGAPAPAWSIVDPAAGGAPPADLSVTVATNSATEARLRLTASGPAGRDYRLMLATIGGPVTRDVAVTERVLITVVDPAVVRQQESAQHGLQLRVVGQRLPDQAARDDSSVGFRLPPGMRLTDVSVNDTKTVATLTLTVDGSPKPAIEYDARGKPIKRVKRWVPVPAFLQARAAPDAGDTAETVLHRLAEAFVFEDLVWGAEP